MSSSDSVRSIARLRKVGTYEGISFLLLLGIAMPLKYIWDEPMGVKIVGWAHGVLFVGYCFVLLEAKITLGWSVLQALPYFIASLVPFGPFVADRRLRAEQQRLANSSAD